jgi:general stress protein YciG
MVTDEELREEQKAFEKSRRRGRGFAGMDPERHRQISSRGGKAAHEKGTAREFTPEEAQRAGRMGGLKVSRNASHMAEIGRRGGAAGKSRSRRRHSRDAHIRCPLCAPLACEMAGK